MEDGVKLFGQLVRTVVNVATLPVAVARDSYEVLTGDDVHHKADQVERLKREAGEDED